MKTTLALLAALIGSTIHAADDPKPTPEGVEAVNACHTNCLTHYVAAADRMVLNSTVRPDNMCRHSRNLLVSTRACLGGCDEVRKAYGYPASSVRNALKADLDADETEYAKQCGEKHPLDEGVAILP